ncbi:unnamed protein product [Pleuronectes platessa]|uniref:Uncharacterized protein n=1 Tax=Pleuronectes platessa TaxID=8262 RepID=A0A9N7Z4B5_PLEPL|nr:unnamed protein product [Pleuronectes platessa]
MGREEGGEAVEVTQRGEDSSILSFFLPTSPLLPRSLRPSATSPCSSSPPPRARPLVTTAYGLNRISLVIVPLGLLHIQFRGRSSYSCLTVLQEFTSVVKCC